jgi:uncharacterized protein (TIGR03435 family)
MKWTASLAICLFCCASVAQNQNVARRVEFDAASVKIADGKPTRGVSGRMKGGPGTGDPGRIVCTQMPLDMLLPKAWDVEFYRVFGPDWLTQSHPDVYTIEATMPPETTKPQFQLMFQNLLIERFQIRFHHETKMFSGYRLIVAPGGPKLRESANADTSDSPVGRGGQQEFDSDGCPVLQPGHREIACVGSSGDVREKFQNYTMAELASNELKDSLDQLSGQWRTHIVDATGLSGKYDFTLKYDNHADTEARPLVARGIRSAPSPEEGSANNAGSGLPNIFKAIEQQLGLRLVKVNGGIPLDAIVIDHIEKIPTGN